MNEDLNNDKDYSVIGYSPVAFWLTHFYCLYFVWHQSVINFGIFLASKWELYRCKTGVKSVLRYLTNYKKSALTHVCAHTRFMCLDKLVEA